MAIKSKITGIAKALNFKAEAHDVALFVQGADKAAIEKAADIATKSQKAIISVPRAKAQAALYDALVAEFKALQQTNKDGILVPRYTAGTCKTKASEWSTVIVELAWGTEFEQCPNLHAAYVALTKGKGTPRAPKAIGAKSAKLASVPDHLKADLKACKDISTRHALAVNAVMAVADGLKDNTKSNKELATVLEFALAHPAEILALMQSKKVIREGRKIAAAKAA